MASSSSPSPSASPEETHSTLESGTVTDGVKSIDSPDHNSHGNHTDLPTRIHVASRAIHHTLHQAVVGRLPLALPPKTTSPHLYALGISRFSRIYSTFETAWRDYLHTPPPTDHDPNNDQTRYHSLLSEAYIPAITRSARLTSDISNLQREWGDEVASVAQPAEHAAALRDAVAHITETAQRKPYALLAYSWIMYMALFNGGRWIRDQLVNAGPEFWSRESHNEKADSAIESTFLSFWSFDGDEDGEDIKRAFRAGFVEASRKHLTETERDDVIHEAKALFQHCINIVSEIDVVVALERKRQDDELRGHQHQEMGMAERQSLLIIIIFGVGLALAISYYARIMTCLGY